MQELQTVYHTVSALLGLHQCSVPYTQLFKSKAPKNRITEFYLASLYTSTQNQKCMLIQFTVEQYINWL